MNMDDIFSQFWIFSAVPLVVADLEAEAVNAELGSNLRIKVKLTLEEANGVEKK
jgi:hypothetical protein